jgi:hypothetical protein
MAILERLDTSISQLPGSSPVACRSHNQNNTIALRLRAAGRSFFWAMQLLPYQRREACTRFMRSAAKWLTSPTEMRRAR